MRLPAFAAMLLAAAAIASAEVSATRVPAELRSCVDIQRNTERLACFDRGIDALLQPEAKSAAGTPSAESSFGLFAQAPSQTNTDTPSRAQIESLEGRVVSISTASDGSALIVLDNAQSWRQISGSATLLLKVGDAVVIRRAALGSFQLSTPNGRSAKVKRVR
ncbi:MAG: hypothetical protein ABI821_03430 [Pseudomonadota bacterium]